MPPEPASPANPAPISIRPIPVCKISNASIILSDVSTRNSKSLVTTLPNLSQKLLLLKANSKDLYVIFFLANSLFYSSKSFMNISNIFFSKSFFSFIIMYAKTS